MAHVCVGDAYQPGLLKQLDIVDHQGKFDVAKTENFCGRIEQRQEKSKVDLVQGAAGDEELNVWDLVHMF